MTGLLAGSRAQAGSPSVTTYLVITVVLMLSGLFVYREHPLVQLASDPPDTSVALFPTGDLQPGQSTTAWVTLVNQGVIPFDYQLSVTGPAGQPASGDFQLRVRRASDQSVRYIGALPARSGAIGKLDPGTSVRLELTLTNPASNIGGRTSLNLLFNWSAQGILLGDWWMPVYALGLAALDMGILALWLADARRRRASPRPAAEAA